MTSLIPAFGNIGFTLVAFIVALSIIVAIHEYGHYIVGRWSGIHADVFSIGFGKVLWSKTDKHGTVWQIAALPFGGYVKFKGDSNAASMPTPDTAEAGEVAPTYGRDTMLGAPLWARSATVAAGPIFNFILSFFVFAGILLFNGQASTPLTVDSVPPLPDTIENQLEPGDRVFTVNGVTLAFPDGFDQLVVDLPSQPTLTYGVERDGARIEVVGPQPRSTLVQSITPRSAADDADLKIGDMILSMNGAPVYKFLDMIDIVDATGEAPIALQVWRAGEVFETTLTPRMTAIPQQDGSIKDEPKIGVGGGLVFDPATVAVGFVDAVRLAAQQVWFIIAQSIKALGSLIAGAINTCNLSGPVGIAETSGSMASQGLVSFISFIAVLSTAVGLLNLFPIPILDGGHLVFHAYEAVTGKMPSDGALRILMAIGLALIGTLMLFAIFNDLIFCP